MPSLGVVDIGRLVGPTVYPATARPGLDQLSAMPSVHVAWAMVVVWTVVHVLRSRWRWLAVAYPMATLFVVITTGNHYWADGFVAAAMCAVTFAGVAAWDRRRRPGPVGAGSEEPAGRPVPTGS